ncbi:maleylpyruvate isomerase N-terminal domain-containing protein [Amycolatopsis sp. NPDC059027]|uniref:maleylpyruvate isomerase N-terminal domain-containing protein n=1 Tax=unclassified Amycolatopsis TaxID=2618356 RepID=UPI0036726217
MAITQQRWDAVRVALPQAGARFADLVTGAPDPATAVTADWDITQTAAHVGYIALLYTTMVRGTDEPLRLPGLAESIARARTDSVAAMNELAFGEYRERDPVRLSENLRADIDEILRESADLDPEKPVSWLGGSLVPVAGVLAHLLNELLIHGLDIARAVGVSWPIRSADEALFLELFLIGMTRNGVGTLLDGAVPSPRRIAVEFRSAYTEPVVMALQHGHVTVEEPDGASDVRLSFDPAVLVPMMFGRIGKLRAVLSRGVVIRGPRPWLLREFLKTVRMP